MTREAKRLLRQYDDELLDIFKEAYDRLFTDLASLEGVSLEVLQRRADTLARYINDAFDQSIVVGERGRSELLDLGFIEASPASVDIVMPLQAKQAVLSYNNIASLPEDVTANIFGTVEDLMQKYRTKAVDNVIREINIGYINGQSLTKTSKKVKDIMNISKSDASRIVRTESLRNYSKGELVNQVELKNQGYNIQVVWSSATGSERTRVSHKNAEGQIQDADGFFYVGGEKLRGPRLGVKAKNNINCRCTTLTRIIE